MTDNCYKPNYTKSRSLGAPGKQGPADYLMDYERFMAHGSKPSGIVMLRHRCLQVFGHRNVPATEITGKSQEIIGEL